MTVLIDTSVWVNLLRDATGSVARRGATIVGDDEVALTRFTQMELLQGAADDREWGTLSDYLMAKPTSTQATTPGLTRRESSTTSGDGE